MRSLRQHFCNGWDAHTVPTRVGRLGIQGGRNQSNKRLIDRLQLVHEDCIVEQYSRKTCQRLYEWRHLLGKGSDRACCFIDMVEQLQHTDDCAFMILQWHRQK